MARKLVALLLLALVILGANAQDEACSILVLWETEDSPAAARYLLENENYMLDVEAESEALVFAYRDSQIFEPLVEAGVYSMTWSPERTAIAYIGDHHGLNDYFALFVTELSGTRLYTHRLDETTFARYQWLTDEQIAVTECAADDCQASIADIASGEVTTIDFGPYVPEAYLAWRDSYIVSRVTDRAVGLWDGIDGFRQYISGEQAASRPIVSGNGRYVALRLNTDDGPRLRILDLIDSKLHRTLGLQDELSVAADESEWTGLFPLAPVFGQWHPREAELVYSDDDATHIYNALSNREIAVIDQGGTPHWVCGNAE